MTSALASAQSNKKSRSSTNLAAFIVGLPLAGCILGFIYYGPLADTPVERYVSHTVECVEVVMFCCAVSALGAKLFRQRMERRVFHQEVMASWDGPAVPLSEATPLLAGVSRVPSRFQNTALVRRLSSVLDFLCRRGSSADLDDQLRALADNDTIALEGSYSLIRFITWAIPILGFLGTVLGITGAISGVTPEALENSLSTVTDGLAFAFDATALALALTMVTMFFSFLVERTEQGTLEAVDRYAEQHLAHRFVRPTADAGPFVEVVRQSTQVMASATEDLVRRQAELWSKTIEEADRRRAQGEKHHQEIITSALEAALERTLHIHNLRLAALEKQAIDQSTAWLERLTLVAQSVGEQQSAMALIAEGMAAQADALARLQDNEKQLLQLQETLNRNLATLAGAGAFEQAVHSLTAAVHLLTARVSIPLPASPGNPPAKRLGAAA